MDEPARHVPVLPAEALAALNIRAGGVYVDGTFGAGGYTSRILDIDGTRVFGLDRDRTAIAGGAGLVERARGRLTLVEARFSELERVLRNARVDTIDGVVLDVGVSSMQLDTAARGFSFRENAPLDMRMGGDGPTAADVIAVASERNLAIVLRSLGEERFARPLARALVKARATAPITTTTQLSEIVTSIVHPRPGQIHPATRTFQALRILVNEELDELAAGLAAAERVLAPAGRLVVVAFHSLEDRIVKSFLAARGRAPAVSRHLPEAEAPTPSFRILTGRPVVADLAEVARNPRARSAKLRAAERTEAPAHSAEMPADWPTLNRVMQER